ESALILIVASSGGHVRDAIKLLDSLSIFGDITLSATKSYLKYDLNTELLKILVLAHSETKTGLAQLESLLEREATSSISRRILSVLMRTEELRIGRHEAFDTDLEKFYAIQIIENWGHFLPESLKFWLDPGIRQTKEQICCDFLLFAHKLATAN